MVQNQHGMVENVSQGEVALQAAESSHQSNSSSSNNFETTGKSLKHKGATRMKRRATTKIGGSGGVSGTSNYPGRRRPTAESNGIHKSKNKKLNMLEQ